MRKLKTFVNKVIFNLDKIICWKVVHVAGGDKKL